MSDNVIFNAGEDADSTDITGSRTITDFTQVASCAVGDRNSKGVRISLRERLERERLERQQDLERTLSQSFRNLLKGV